VNFEIVTTILPSNSYRESRSFFYAQKQEKAVTKLILAKNIKRVANNYSLDAFSYLEVAKNNLLDAFSYLEVAKNNLLDAFSYLEVVINYFLDVFSYSLDVIH
jgi:predicted transcriptional regulator